MENKLKEEEEKDYDEFKNILENVLTEDEFWEYIRSWKDPLNLCEEVLETFSNTDASNRRYWLKEIKTFHKKKRVKKRVKKRRYYITFIHGKEIKGYHTRILNVKGTLNIEKVSTFLEKKNNLENVLILSFKELKSYEK